MATAHVNELGIVLRGLNPIDQPAGWWESLLDELKAHHIPSLHQRGKRMSVDASACGGVRGVVHFTADTVSKDQAIEILKKRGIAVYDLVESGE